MAVMPQQKPAAQPKVEAPKVEVKQVRAVLGDLHDPFTQTVYTQTPQPVDEIKPGSWLDCQIEAGKIALC